MQKCNENAANRYSYVGEVYNVGGHNEMRNIDIVKLGLLTTALHLIC